MTQLVVSSWARFRVEVQFQISSQLEVRLVVSGSTSEPVGVRGQALTCCHVRIPGGRMCVCTHTLSLCRCTRTSGRFGTRTDTHVQSGWLLRSVSRKDRPEAVRVPERNRNASSQQERCLAPVPSFRKKLDRLVLCSRRQRRLLARRKNAND